MKTLKKMTTINMVISVVIVVMLVKVLVAVRNELFGSSYKFTRKKYIPVVRH